MNKYPWYAQLLLFLSILLRAWMDWSDCWGLVRMNSPNICVLNMRHVNGTNSWITKSRKVDSFGFRVTPKGHFYILQLKFSVIWGHSRSNLFTLTAMIELTDGSENPEGSFVIQASANLRVNNWNFLGPRNNQREYFKQLQIIEIKMLVLSFSRVTSVVNEFWKRQNYILKTLKVPTNFSSGILSSNYAFLMLYS